MYIPCNFSVNLKLIYKIVYQLKNKIQKTAGDPRGKVANKLLSPSEMEVLQDRRGRVRILGDGRWAARPELSRRAQARG